MRARQFALAFVMLVGVAAGLLAAGSSNVSKKSSGVSHSHVQSVMKNQKNAVSGMVTHVKFGNKSKTTGSFTVNTRIKKKDSLETAKEKSGNSKDEIEFKVTKSTKFETVILGKGKQEHKDASFTDVDKGDLLVVISKAGKNDVPETVLILESAKEGK